MVSLLFLAPASWALLGEKHEEPPHYTRAPFKVPGLSASVEQLALGSDQHLDVVAARLGTGSGRIVALRNDGRGLAANWSAAVVVSANTEVPRLLNEDSCQVFGDQAFVAWLDDGAGAAASRVVVNRYDQGTLTWSGPVTLPDSTYPGGSDVRDFRMVVKRGTSGSTYVAVLAQVRAGGQDRLFLTVSFDAGATYLAPVSVSQGLPGVVEGLDLDLRFGELHLAWADDRAGTKDVYYRRAILSFGGVPTFAGAETALSTGAGSSSLGRIVLETNAEFGWTGSNQKYVGIAHRQMEPDGTTDLHVYTSRDNGASFVDVLIAQTAIPTVDVEDFDLEICGDTFNVVWQDDREATPQLFRADSDDGLAFSDAVKVSGFEQPANVGFQPRLSPSSGTPDGLFLVFVEENEDGDRSVLTSFADQAFGGTWHDEEYPRASATEFEPPVPDMRDPDVSYNELYYNFVVAWRQESSPGSGLYELVLGGYRPPQVVLEVAPNALRFEVFHVPFEDTFGFVLVSLAPPTSGPGLVLYDGRRTGLVPDALTNLWLTSHWQYAIFENDPDAEGGATAPILLPPMLSAFDITFLAASWGPFGELHTLTEPFRATVDPLRTPWFRER